MKNNLLFVLFIALVFSCGNDKKETPVKTPTEPKTETKTFDDSAYALDDKYPVGDVRRYGIYPDSIHSAGNRKTKKSRVQTMLDVAEQGVEITFPKGYYKTALVLKGRQDVKINFNDAVIAGMIQIFEKDSTPSKEIAFKGNLTSYGGFFTRKSNHIDIQSLTIASNSDKSIGQLLSKGCKISSGSKNIKIDNLIIEDLGSGSSAYKHNGAALSIEGWNNNPENVQIKKVLIKSTDRHGIYLTGNDHLIGDVVIEQFGVGNAKGMSPMQDAGKGEEKEFKALWVNKCYDSFIENITINEKNSKAKYTAHFDTGNKQKPVTIGTFKVINDNPNIKVLEEPKNGVVIEENI